MFKKIVASLAVVLLTVGMSVVGIAAPAAAAPPGGGTYPPTGSDAMQANKWVELPGVEECYKIDDVNAESYALPSPDENPPNMNFPAGSRQFSKVIVKAASDESVVEPNLILTDGLAEGTVVRHNSKHDISHLILCTVPTPVDPTPTPVDPIPMDASATVTTTPATCEAAEGGLMVAAVNATSVTSYPTPTTYEVTATADPEHSFAAGDGVSEDGSTMLLSGTLDPQKTGTECTSPPNCIPGSAVSYTYDPTSNSGSIHVENVPSATGELCRGFWVTATSWKYKTDKVWPQTLDQLDYVNGKQKITLPGDYAFEAVMTCGQGDIYASFDEQPVPTQTLAGPSDPYDEFFLHQMGFTGPAWPTYFNQTPGCNTVMPVAPDVTKTTECGVAPTVVAKATTGVDYEVVLDSTTGDYVVTATPQPNHYFAGDDDQVVIFEGNIGVLVTCVAKGNVSAAFGKCTAGAFDDGLSSDLSPSRSATLTFDNSKSTKPVLFQVIGFPEYDTTVAARDTVKVDIATATGTSFRVMASGKTFDIPIPACDLPPFALVTPTYAVTQPTCTTAGSYTLGSEGGDVVWTVNGKTGVASGTYPAPADYSKVTISAVPVDEKSTLYDWVNPVELKFAAPTGCIETPPVSRVASASVTTTPATCSAAESNVVVTVTNATFTLTYPTATSFKVTATASGGYLFSDQKATSVIGREFDLKLVKGCELPSFALVTPTFSVIQPTCTKAGSYTLGSVVGELVWTVNGKPGIASGTYPSPADYSAVTITAAPAVKGDGLDPDWANPVVLRFAAPSGACSFNPPTLPLNPTLPFNPPTLAFTGLTIGAGISLAGGLLFVGLAGLFVARHRRLHG